PIAGFGFGKARATVSEKVGCPARIPHDLRRRAVRSPVPILRAPGLEPERGAFSKATRPCPELRPPSPDTTHAHLTLFVHRRSKLGARRIRPSPGARTRTP